jgi:hypothetical protein
MSDNEIVYTVVKSSFMNPLRWALFFPAYFVIPFLFNWTGIDLISYFVSSLASVLGATLIAPTARTQIVLIFSGISVIQILKNLYTPLQLIYMVTAILIAIAIIFTIKKDRA